METTSSQNEQLSLIRCTTGPESYVFPMDAIEGIHDTDQLSFQSGPDGVIGFLRVKARHIPIVSLAAQLQRPFIERPGHRQVVKFRDAALPWGIQVNHAAQLPRVTADRFRALPSIRKDSDMQFSHGVVMLGEQMHLVLEPAAVRRPGSPLRRSSIPFSSSAHGDSALQQTHGTAGKVLVFETATPTRGKRPIRFAIGMTHVMEIIHEPTWIPLPGAAAHVLGLCRWRDRPILVVDLSRRLGMFATSVQADSRLLIAKSSAQELIGFVVQPSIRIVQLPLPHVACVRKLAARLDQIHGAVELEGETVIFPKFGS